MTVGNSRDTSDLNDPSWKLAYQLSHKIVPVPSQAWRLVRGAWLGQMDQSEFLRLLGFTRFSALSLLDAAEMLSPEVPRTLASVEQAIRVLGVRLSVVVLAINHTGHCILANKPPPWRALFEELITCVEVGYRMGARVPDIGIEGGALMGFAKAIGYSVLMASNPKKYRDWSLRAKSSKPGSDRKGLYEAFGCEPYQIAAFLIQQLGFGPDVSQGVAFGGSGLSAGQVKLDEFSAHWRAIYRWAEALREGRNYPGELDVRNRFKELAPISGSQGKNLVLEVVHTEIAKVRTEGSKWTWHLPRPGYQETIDHLGIGA